MLLYLVSLLLPAATLALCNQQVIMTFFDNMDVNYDNKVTRRESDTFFQALDVNGDDEVTLKEVKERVNKVVPKMKGHEDEIFDFIENDTDVVITAADIDLLFCLIDRDKDGATSWSEYTKYLQNTCQPPKPQRPEVSSATTGTQSDYFP